MHAYAKILSLKTGPKSLLACTLATLPAIAAAQSPGSTQVFEVTPDSGDTAWILAASALVLLMAIPGASLFYGGSVRMKNMVSVIAQTFAVTAAVSLFWIIIGYSLTFGDGPMFIGTGVNFMLKDLGTVAEGTTIPESGFALFQMVVAVFATVLLIGALAERVRFGWMTLFALFWSLFVYVPIARAVWAGGWLMDKGVVDFAGGLVVHISVGVSALVLSIMLRRGETRTKLGNHGASPELALVGAGMLWVGWFGISGGMALGASDDAASAIINTHIAACAAALIWAGLDRFRTGSIKPMGIANGALAGLVTISAGAAFVAPAWAMIMGLAGGVAAYYAIQFINQRYATGNGVTMFGVHGIAAMVGTILTGIFLSEKFNGGGFPANTGMAAQVGIQAIGVALVAMWSVIGTLIVGYGISMVMSMQGDENATSDLDNDG